MDVQETAVQALDSAKSAHHRIDSLETEVKDVHELAIAMAETRKEVTGMKDDIGEIKDSVAALTGHPAQLWNTLVIAVITALVSGAIGFVIAQLH